MRRREGGRTGKNQWANIFTSSSAVKMAVKDRSRFCRNRPRSFREPSGLVSPAGPSCESVAVAAKFCGTGAPCRQGARRRQESFGAGNARVGSHGGGVPR
jgi:hypothetical protein